MQVHDEVAQRAIDRRVSRWRLDEAFPLLAGPPFTRETLIAPDPDSGIVAPQPKSRTTPRHTRPASRTGPENRLALEFFPATSSCLQLQQPATSPRCRQPCTRPLFARYTPGTQ